MRKATQAEQKTYLARKVPVVQSFTLDDEGLDYRDWDVTDAGEEMEELRKRNDTLEKELKRARKINDVLSAELLQPATGVPDSLALRGFDEAWEAAASDTSSAALFPEPPTSTSEDIRITRNVRMWRQSSVEAIKDYNKQLRWWYVLYIGKCGPVVLFLASVLFTYDLSVWVLLSFDYIFLGDIMKIQKT